MNQTAAKTSTGRITCARRISLRSFFSEMETVSAMRGIYRPQNGRAWLTAGAEAARALPAEDPAWGSSMRGNAPLHSFHLQRAPRLAPRAPQGRGCQPGLL